MKNLVYILLLICLSAYGNAQPVIINEVAYVNKTSLSDDDGDFPDWFELYNPGDQPVNLLNYRITDDTLKTDCWMFQHLILEPHKYLVVYASGKNKCNGRFIHTDFKIRNMKESLFLICPGGQIIDQVDASCVPADCSKGCYPDGSGHYCVLRPTPGMSNNEAEQVAVHYVTDSLAVNYESGLYDQPVTIALTNLHNENMIVYTLDGSDPDEESAVYSQPLYLDNLTFSENRFADIPESSVDAGNLIFKASVLRAMVYSNGCPASNEISNTYFVSDNIKTRYPVNMVSLITDKENFFDDDKGIYVAGKHRNFDQHGNKWERPVHIEIFDSSGVQIIDQDAGIRIHGRGSRNKSQKSLRLYAGEKYGKESFSYPFFSQKPGLTSFKTLLLRSTGGCFGVLFKDELCHHLVSDMNIDYLAGETSVLFVNGEYWGIYNLMERQDKYYIENNYQVTDAELDIIGYDMENILVEEGSLEPYNEVVRFLESSDPSSDTFYTGIGRIIDLEGLIDYFVAQLYFANFDFPQNNLELWKMESEGSRWRYFFFDLDFAMMKLNYDHLSEYNNTLDDFQRFPAYSTLILRGLLQNQTFRDQFQMTCNHHLGTTFNPARVISIIEYFQKKYAPLVPEHIYRWHDPADYVKWEDEVAWLKIFAMQRPVIVAEQLQNNFGEPFHVYPNPCRDYFNIDFSGYIGSATVRIFSMKGELVNQVEYDPLQGHVLEVATNMTSGLYALHINTQEMTFTTKMIILP